MQYQYTSKWKAYLDNKTHKHSFLTQKVSAIKLLVEEGCVWAGLTLCYYALWKGVILCFSTQRYYAFLISKRHNNAFSLCIIMPFSVIRNFIQKGRYSVNLFYSDIFLILIGFRKHELIINVLWFVFNTCIYPFRKLLDPSPFFKDRNKQTSKIDMKIEGFFFALAPTLNLLPTLL